MDYEYYDAIDFPSNFKTPEELNAAITHVLHSTYFIRKFAENENRQSFLRWDKTGSKINYQKSHYLDISDIRFVFNIDIRNDNVEVVPYDGNSEISSPGKTFDYLARIIAKVIAKNGRTCMVSEAEGEKYGYAIKRDELITLDFTPHLEVDGEAIRLDTWIQNKEAK